MLHTIVLLTNAHDVELLGLCKRNGSEPVNILHSTARFQGAAT